MRFRKLHPAPRGWLAPLRGLVRLAVRAASGCVVVLSAGCFAPAVHAVRMAEPAQVVVSGAVQGIDLWANGLSTPKAAGAELTGSVAVGLPGHLQVEANGAVDPELNFRASGGARYAWLFTESNQMQFAAHFDYGRSSWPSIFASSYGTATLVGGDLEGGFVHHAPESWVSVGEYVDVPIVLLNSNASLGLTLMSLVELAPPDWRHFGFVGGVLIGIPLATGHAVDDSALGFLQLCLGVVARF